MLMGLYVNLQSYETEIRGLYKACSKMLKDMIDSDQYTLAGVSSHVDSVTGAC